jgi:hypothetical protein
MGLLLGAARRRRMDLVFNRCRGKNANGRGRSMGRLQNVAVLAGVLAVWIFTGGPPRALAADAARAFHEAAAAAYAPCREAVYYIETGNAGLAGLAIDRALAEWRGVEARFAAAPPGPYAKDAKWKATLAGIEAALAVAAKAADARDADGALAALASVRTDLAELRARNGQRVYSDCIDAMNAAMDRLWAFRARPPDRAEPTSIAAFKSAVADTQRWYRRCRDEAPPSFAGTDEFKRLFAGALAGLERLDGAAGGPADRLVSILRELHSYDTLIWLRFG